MARADHMRAELRQTWRRASRKVGFNRRRASAVESWRRRNRPHFHTPVLIGGPFDAGFAAQTNGRYRSLRPVERVQRAIDRTLWYPTSTRVIEQFVKSGMTVVDIGANTGYYSAIIARLVGPAGLVLSFEAIETSRPVLRQRATEGNLRVALTGESGVSGEVNEARGVDRSWSARDSEPREAEISFANLDAVVAGLDLERLDFIRIQLDGYEAHLIGGAAETLARFRPTMLLEVCDYTLRSVAGLAGGSEMASDAERMLDGLVDLGYWFLWEGELSPIGAIEEALTRFDLSTRSINLVAYPQRLLEGFPGITGPSEHAAAENAYRTSTQAGWEPLKVRVFETIAELRRYFGFRAEGVILEDDVDVVENVCDLNHRRLRDAEVLTTFAANADGQCLDLGTSYGNSAYKLATNLGTRGTVHTVNILPDQQDGTEGGFVTHMLRPEEIGRFFRDRGIQGIRQHYANTAAWDVPEEVSDLAMVFVDAAHDTEMVLNDSRLGWDRLRPGGFMLWHDFSPNSRHYFDWIDACMRGVEMFLAEKGMSGDIVQLRNSWIGILQKPKEGSKACMSQPAEDDAA